MAVPIIGTRLVAYMSAVLQRRAAARWPFPDPLASGVVTRMGAKLMVQCLWAAFAAGEAAERDSPDIPPWEDAKILTFRLTCAASGPRLVIFRRDTRPTRRVASIGLVIASRFLIKRQPSQG